jgi:WD40 repeat protein
MSFSPTIRLFVSSTFSDLKAERDALQCEVFPRLKQLCLSKGLRFQPIDLRWGISEEAGRDNRTMRICLRELHRCQQDRPKPNFLILLGDRYGWRPLPEIIPSTLFEQLEKKVRAENPELAKLLGDWYQRDENGVPPVYELQPRHGRFVDIAPWESEVERPLLAALVDAAESLRSDPACPAPLRKTLDAVAIGASATEQEIIEGALKVPDAATHVRAFFRTIDGLPDPAPEDYVETGEAANRLKKLKDRIGKHIGADNVCEYRVSWCSKIAPREDEPESDVASDGRIPTTPKPIGIHPDDLKEFCDQAWKQLSNVVEQQIAALAEIPPGELEEQAHQDFGKERCQHFVGRVEPLERIANYLRQESEKPLAVIGPAGSGKSAVMAKAAEAIAECGLPNAELGKEKSEIQNPESAFVLARFIGATPGSSDLIQLLGNLIAEIRRRYPAPVITEPESREEGKAKPGDAEIPFEYNPLLSAFHEALQRPTTDQPLWIFLDALDQLTAGNNAHSLAWLPAKLSPHVRLVVSAALPSESGTGVPPMGSETTDPRVAVIAALNARLDATQRVTLAPLATADGEQMLANWLADAHRTLQEPQRKAILKDFLVEGSPLWLRTAAEEAARLVSWKPAPSFAPTTPGLLGQVLDRLSWEEEHGEILVSRTLSYLACARHGLAEDEILEILSADKEVMADFQRRSPDSPKTESLPVSVWVRLQGDLAFYLAEHQAQGASLLGFYHRNFLEAVTARCLAERETRQARHQHLADWFGKQAWFLAPAIGRTGQAQGAITDPPNTRKASELPWHLYKTADESDPQRCQETVWQPLAEALCNLLLVEAKVRSRLVFELQEDYRLALHALPETGPEMREQQEREARIKRWTAEIIAYARSWSERGERLARGEPILESEPVLPELVSACRMWTEEEIEAECRRISELPTSLDRLVAFEGHVTSQCYPLIKYGMQSGFALQHAFNCEPAGPVHNAASEVLPALGMPRFLRRWPPAARPSPLPALLRTLEGHSDSVKGVSVTPDSRRAVSAGGWDLTLRVWDLETGACLRTLEEHSNSVSMTPDGRRAISASHDYRLRVWDLETGACLRVLKGHSHFVESVSMTPDGRRAVSASSDKTVRVWDLANGTCLRTLEGHTTPVTCVSLTPDGRRAISGSGDYQRGDCVLRVWDLESGGCLRALENPNEPLRCVSVTADGRRAVSGSGNGLRFWDLETGACLRALKGHSGWVHSVTVTPDGRRAVSASDDKTLRVWDLETGACLRTLEGHSDSVRSVTVTPDGRRAMSASDDKTLRVWNLQAGVGRPHSEWVNAPLSCLSMTPDGLRAVSGHSDKLRVWDIESGACLRTLESGQHSECVSTLPDSLRAVSGDGWSLRLWDLESGTCLRTLSAERDGASRVCVTPDGRRAVSGGAAGNLRVWDLESGTYLRTLNGSHHYLEHLSVTPDGGRVVSAGGYGQPLRVWDLESGLCIHSLEVYFPEGCGHSVKSMSMSPDGRRVVSGGDEKTLRVWDLETGVCLHTLEGHLGTVGCVRMTPDGRCAVSGSEDKTLRVWNLETGACLSTLRGHGGKVNWLSVTPDSRRAVSGSGDHTLRVWDLESGTCAALFLASAAIVSGAISPSANSFVCGTDSGEVIILELRGIEFGPPASSSVRASADARRV